MAGAEGSTPTTGQKGKKRSRADGRMAQRAEEMSEKSASAAVSAAAASAESFRKKLEAGLFIDRKHSISDQKMKQHAQTLHVLERRHELAEGAAKIDAKRALLAFLDSYEPVPIYDHPGDEDAHVNAVVSNTAPDEHFDVDAEDAEEDG